MRSHFLGRETRRGRRPDIVINNAGGPPPGDFRTWDRQVWIEALDTNLLSAVEMIRLTADGMAGRGFGRIINITSSTVRVPIPVLGLSNAARAGLTNFVFGLAPELSSKGIAINNLLPGPFDTSPLRNSKDLTLHLTRNPVAGRMGERRKKMRSGLAGLKSRHKEERIFLHIQQRFEECRILTRRERQKPKGFLAWFCKATGIEAMIERKRAIQDQERESVKRAVFAELEKSQTQEEESLKRQYEIMMKHSTASKCPEEKLKLELGIRARSTADAPEPHKVRLSPFG